MNTIDNINKQYTDKLKTIDYFQKSLNKIKDIQFNSKYSKKEKATLTLDYLNKLRNDVDYIQYPFFDETVSLGNCYFSCIDAIDSYKKVLLSLNDSNSASIEEQINRIETTQNNYDHGKKTFNEKYGYSIDSIEELNQVFVKCLDSSILISNNQIDELKEEASDIVNRQSPINLKISDTFQTIEELPTSMYIARCLTQSKTQMVLRDIGITNAYQNISINLRDNGNIIVNSDFKSIGNEIDELIIAYILRFIESFPLGAVRVHIFNQNASYIYKRLNNGFKREDMGDNMNNIVQIYSSFDFLSNIRDVICEDIFKKTSIDKPDLYSIYNSDKSDPFNLIVIRDGFVDGSGFVSAELLDTIYSLSNPDNTGHKCGLRFLIIDNSSSFSKNLNDTSKHLINQIHDNCELIIDYESGNYSISGNKAEVIRIKDDMELFVQERTQAITDAIRKKEKNYISLDEVSSNKLNNRLGSIINIPIGKFGDQTVELPLSCKDENGTVAGQCIGYMAIGQSGSGKSSFFHSVVLNGCLKYSPKDLQFWLLDFKSGGASSKYSRSGIPHIRIIAENNKIDDALCLFQMILEEMKRRYKAFNTHFTDNIVEYNQLAEAENLEYFPRIIIAIDEVQEIFRDDNASTIQKQISAISTRMRSAGMHFVMVAQNLSEGKSYMLKEAFLPSATGRICFRVAADIPRDSGFEEEFIEHRKEITELKTGEAYVSYGKNTIKKVKMAFVSTQNMADYFEQICNRYPAYANIRPLVIGTRKRLLVTAPRQGSNRSYLDELIEIAVKNEVYTAIIGEDVYRMSPFTIQFSQYENSSVLFLGSDKYISSSMCASTAISLIRQGVEIHLFNADKTKIRSDNGSISHPFMYMCQNLSPVTEKAFNHRLDQLNDVVRSLYTQYLERKDLVQKADDEEPIFDPVFLVINDLYGIESFTNNDIIENEQSESPINTSDISFEYDLFKDVTSNSSSENGHFRENIQNIMSELLKNGYRYNIHSILSIKGDPSVWRSLRITSEINNIILFNDTEYSDQIDNAYFLKEMLKNISNEGKDETMAVCSRKRTLSKIRPIIYNMSNQAEQEALDMLLK